MKKFNPKMIPVLMMALLFTVSLTAQETTVTVKVKKEGRVVKDTTYIFEDEVQAEHAMKMMDIMCEDDGHMMKVHKKMAEHHGGHSKTMVFISEDGKTTEIKEMEGDSMVWITEGEHEGDHVKVMKYKMDGDEAHGKHVVVVKSGDGETFDILIDEDCEGEHGDKKIVKKKEITVIVSGDDDGEWTVVEQEMKEIDEDEDVEVIVIKEKKDKKKSKKQ